ncbi:hypothetical protein KSF_055430 [Reticulibacter mediterranei]|uniref:Uncharacterized protein n=1 Tax=Reticulibacter mediterranei TaxID=2778369 RepID=A0A8J3IN94_9CHLR|nr:hypothetical protein KSF_055430 [Reticulibacter mediterranei]
MIERLHTERSAHRNTHIFQRYRALLNRFCSIHWIQRLLHILSTENQQDEEQVSSGDQNQGNSGASSTKKSGNVKKDKTKGGR